MLDVCLIQAGETFFSHLVVVSWLLALYSDLPLRQGGAGRVLFRV
jgi:hypothetical protein